MKRNLFSPPIISNKNKVAFLKIESDRNRGKDFYHSKNIGISMLVHVLINSGYDVHYTDKENAYKYDIILISLTSPYDMIALYKYLYNHKGWLNRKFKVLAGGPGMQNYIPIHEFIDYAWFGRAENEIAFLLDNNLDVEHPSLLKIGYHKNVIINQSNNLFKEVFDIFGRSEKEDMLGCKNKCFYCYYSYSRKYIKTKNNTFYTNIKSGIKEIEKCNILQYDKNYHQITTSIDGYSDRIRDALNVKLKKENIKEFFEHITNTCTKKQLIVRLYNIIGFETETDNDIYELHELLEKINYAMPIRLEIQNTPLTASPNTPVKFSKLNFNIDYNKRLKKIYVNNKANVHYSMFIGGLKSHLEMNVPLRTNFENIDIFKAMCSQEFYKSKDYLSFLDKKGDFNTISRFYSTNEQTPTCYIKTYINDEIIKNHRIIMGKKLYGENTFSLLNGA